MRYLYLVGVEASSSHRADRVVCERVLYDEDYGFPYTIEVEWSKQLTRTGKHEKPRDDYLDTWVSPDGTVTPY